MARQGKRLMVIGAHPDDAEFHAGGLMALAARAGHKLSILALTDGSAGHHEIRPPALARVRRQEALDAAARLDAGIHIWNQRDGELTADLALRHKLIVAIREFAPDVIVTHRPADYHPDHRATAQLVQDAVYLLQVPSIEAEVPALDRLPAVLLAWDRFTYPRPFRADWVVDTGPVLDDVVDLLACHASQVYEWLPHVLHMKAPAVDRRGWLREWYARRPAEIARRYGTAGMRYAEAFEISEYGGTFTASEFALHSGDV